MSHKRLIFQKGKQRELLITILEKEKFTRKELSKNIGVSFSSMKNWVYESRTLPKPIFKVLIEKYPVSEKFTKFVEKEEDSNWGRIKGGINRNLKIQNREKYFRELHEKRRSKSKKVKHITKIKIKSEISRCVVSKKLNPVPLIGVMLLTDGYVCNKGRYAEFAYSSMSTELTEIFSELVKLWKQDIILSEYTNKTGVKTVYFHLAVPNDITKLSPNFKKSPKKVSVQDYMLGPQPSLDFLKNLNKIYRKLSIKLAMTSEGGITFYVQKNKNDISILPRLFLSCANPNLNKDWKIILESLGLNLNVQRDKNKWSGICGLATFDVDCIGKFKDIIGFVDGVKISGKSKYCEGVEKTDLLGKMLGKRDFKNIDSFMSFIK